MKLSKQTIDLLSWCSRIQNAIVIEPGNRLRTISASKGTFFEGNVREVFPTKVAIYNLSQCLAWITETTEISFDDPTFVGLRNGRTLTKVTCVEERLVLKPPSQKTIISNYEETLFLHSDDVYELRRLKGKKTIVEIYALDSSTPIQIDYFAIQDPRDVPAYRHTIQTVKPQFARQQFKIRFRLPNLILQSGSYQLNLARNVGQFNWLLGDAVAWVSIDAANSYFGNPPSEQIKNPTPTLQILQPVDPAN